MTKRASQMKREDFYKHCKNFEKNRLYTKAEVDLLQFPPPTNEYEAFAFIDFLERMYSLQCRTTLDEFLKVSGGRPPDDSIPDEVKNNDLRRYKEWFAYTEYVLSYADLYAIKACDAMAKEHQWSLCKEVVWIAKLIQQKTGKDCAIIHHNAMCRYGFDNLASAYVVGTKSAEMSLFPRYKKALEHLAKKEQENVGLQQAKLDFLLEKSADLLHYEEVEGARQLDTSTAGLIQWDEFVPNASRDLDEAVRNDLPLSKCTAEGDAPLRTADGSFGSLFDTLVGGRDPAQEFNAKDEARMNKEKWERFRQSLSEQQRQCFDILYNDPDLSDTVVAQRMGKTPQDIYNLRGRLKQKWERMSDLP